MKIILGSQSTNRQEALTIAGLEFEVIVPNVDEKQVDSQTYDSLGDRALAIAQLKAEAVVDQVDGDCVVITADGFNECDNMILEKPHDLDEARDMLRRLSDNMTVFYSALVMINSVTGEVFTDVVDTRCWFRELSKEEIEDYVQTTNVMSYSAAYSPLNTKAISFIKKIEGSASGFSHSMPLDVVVPKLKNWGAINYE